MKKTLLALGRAEVESAALAAGPAYGEALPAFRRAPSGCVGAAAAVLILCGVGQAGAQQLLSGNLVVEQVGTTGGSTALSSAAAPVYLDQFTPTGTFVPPPIALPAAGTLPASAPYNLVESGSASSDGLLSRSANGLTIQLPGYNAIPGTAGIASSVVSGTANARTIGVIDGAGAVDTSRAYGFNSAGNFRSVTSLDGTSFYAAGDSGIFYTGSATSGSPASLLSTVGGGNTKSVDLFNGNLFASTSSSKFNGTGSSLGIYQIGSGLPTSAVPGSNVYNIINTGGTSSPFAFQFNTAMTVAYIADDTSSTGGIQKWVLNTTTGAWTKSYTFSFGTTTAAGARGVTVDWSNPAAPIIYATTADAAANRLYSITDTGSGAVPLKLATAGAYTIFRGVDQALLPSTWTSSTGGSWASGNTTTYNAALGAVATPYDNWSTSLVNGTNLAFQKVAASSLNLDNNTALTGVSSLNFTGAGTISGAVDTAYTLTGTGLTLTGGAATSAAGTFSANANTYIAVVANNSTATQTVNLPLTLSAENQAIRAVNGPIVIGRQVSNGGFTLVTAGSRETTFSANLTGAGGLNKVEAGTTTLAAATSFAGATTINGGTLSAAAANALQGTSGIAVNNGGSLLLSGSNLVMDRINDAAGLTLNGGLTSDAGVATFSTGGLSEMGGTPAAPTPGIGALTLASGSILDFGSGASVLEFTGAGTYASGTLFVKDWSGNPGVGGGPDRLLFSADPAPGLVANIQFSGYGTGQNAAIDFGSYYEVVPIPEPETIFAACLLLAGGLWRERRRLLSSRRGVPCA